MAVNRPNLGRTSHCSHMLVAAGQKRFEADFTTSARCQHDTRGQAALEQWLREKDYHLAGLPVPDPEASVGLTIRDLCNQFLTSKQNLVDSGEISRRTFADYHATCERMIKQIGKFRTSR